MFSLENRIKSQKYNGGGGLNAYKIIPYEMPYGGHTMMEQPKLGYQFKNLNRSPKIIAAG